MSGDRWRLGLNPDPLHVPEDGRDYICGYPAGPDKYAPVKEWSDRRKVAFWIIVLIALWVISGGHPIAWIVDMFSSAGCTEGCR